MSATVEYGVNALSTPSAADDSWASVWHAVALPITAMAVQGGATVQGKLAGTDGQVTAFCQYLSEIPPGIPTLPRPAAAAALDCAAAVVSCLRRAAGRGQTAVPMWYTSACPARLEGGSSSASRPGGPTAIGCGLKGVHTEDSAVPGTPAAHAGLL